MNWFVGYWEYDNKTTGSCWGKKCQIFYFYDEMDQIDVFLYADMDNYLIGLNATGQDFLETDRIEYFDESDLGDFILNKTLFSDCNDTRAYDRPIVPDPCKTSSFATEVYQQASKFTLTGTAVGMIVLAAIGLSVFLLF